jgi:hypothetical protein
MSPEPNPCDTCKTPNDLEWCGGCDTRLDWEEREYKREQEEKKND